MKTCISYSKWITMTSKEIQQADLLDILFENRNKSYGAYALRRDYNYRLVLSLGLTLSLVTISILFSFTGEKNNSRSILSIPDPVVLKEYSILPQKEQPGKKPEKKIKQVKIVNRIQIVANNLETDIPDQADIEMAVVSKENLLGESLTDPNKIISTGIETIIEKTPADISSENNFIPVEIPPSFPGGISAWLNFLRKFLQTPEELEAGQKVEVRVKFRIDKDGILSGFEIIQSGGKLFDKEVLRVMKKMPSWKPAIQNNNRVAVAYTQPVIFIGVKE